MTEPSDGYHGVRFYETFGDFGYTMRARLEQLRILGPSLSPFNSFLLLQGIETLPLRMERHCENALAVAKFLDEHELINWVKYPGLPGDKYYPLKEKYMPKGAGSILSFGVRGGRVAGRRFIETVLLASHLANVGDAKTLVIHPASTTHQQMSTDDLTLAGIGEGMIRLSVGIEDIQDIIDDLKQALRASQKG